MTIKFARSFHLGALSLRISTLPQDALMEMSASGVPLLTLIEFLLLKTSIKTKQLLFKLRQLGNLRSQKRFQSLLRAKKELRPQKVKRKKNLMMTAIQFQRKRRKL